MSLPLVDVNQRAPDRPKYGIDDCGPRSDLKPAFWRAIDGQSAAIADHQSLGCFRSRARFPHIARWQSAGISDETIGRMTAVAVDECQQNRCRSGVLPVGPDTYLVTEKSVPGRGVNQTEAVRVALAEANYFCTQNGRQFVPTIMGQVPPNCYAVTFRCLLPTDPAFAQYHLHNAAGRGDPAVVEALLAKGADVNAKDESGITALMWASGHLDVVQALLAEGADVNAKRNDGLTLLMQASQLGHLDVVQALIDRGADVNAKDNSGRRGTPKLEPYWSGQARDHDSRWT